MQSNAKYLALCLISVFLLPIKAEFIGEISLDNRHFFNDGALGQDNNHSSISFSPEIFENLEDDRIFHFISCINSALASALSKNTPRIALVVMIA